MVYSVRVPEVVADVVRQRADGEGKLVWGFRIVHEAEDEISGAHVVREIGEEAVAERIVAQVLNCATAIGVGVSLLDLGLCNGREAFEQDRPNLGRMKMKPAYR